MRCGRLNGGVVPTLGDPRDLGATVAIGFRQPPAMVASSMSRHQEINFLAPGGIPVISLDQ